MSTPSDIHALLASIKPLSPSSGMTAQDTLPPQFHQRSRQPSYDGLSPYTQQHARHNPSVSSHTYSPGPSNTPPRHGSDTLSPNLPIPRSDQRHTPDRTADLLNLLKFSHTTPPVGQQQAPAMGIMQSKASPGQDTGPGDPQKAITKSISPSDLVASLMMKQTSTSTSSAAATGSVSRHSERDNTGEGPVVSAIPEDSQQLLLRLLSIPKPTQPRQAEELSNRDDQQSPTISTLPKSPTSGNPMEKEAASKLQEDEIATKKDARMHVFGSGESRENLQFEAPKPTPPKGGIFTYVNPFEQLTAVSPRNRTSQSKSRSRSGSPVVEISKSKKEAIRSWKSDSKVPTMSASDTSMPENPAPISDEEANQFVLPEHSEEKMEMVSETLEDNEHADEEVEDVADAETYANEYNITEEQEPDPESLPISFTEPLHDYIAESKQELHTDTDQGEAPEKDLQKPPAETEREAAAADDGANGYWGYVEDDVEKETDRVVPVLNFPLKPFISISVKAHSGSLPSLRDDGILDVARLKKEFDQLDRCLTSATSDYIVYALAKNGGIRIIRQDDGMDKQVFRSTRDRIFHVALGTSTANLSPPKEQAVLGIGVSGTVYWATICRDEKDFFEADALESEGLIFPPYPASDENTSGGQLKTRARRSSRHPEFFGIGRGKNIYVVPHQAATNPGYGVSTQRTVDTEKFLKERALKISTGKAGKDFTFSEDDTVIASLDKTGRARFWDIREITESWAWSQPDPVPLPEVRVPLNTFVTGSPSEKSWPTSVLFIDKLRPYVKGIALRYVLVGLKQNHTLQLWDIGLGKAVQELNFPHENESDAICSIAYHPGSGIIVVGHPTRNSVYFIHLSAPRYNLQPMSQATFIKLSNEKDGHLPKPESTACMSGIREISFASKGQLRSLDLLPLTKLSNTQRAPDEENGLFELYVMHSRGVTCLNIRKEDLGWTPDNKNMKSIDALEEGYIEVTDLQSFQNYAIDEPSISGDATTAATPQKSAPKDVHKKTSDLGVDAASAVAAPRTESPAKPQSKKKLSEEQQSEPANGVEKAEKKKKRKGAAATADHTKVKDPNAAAHPPQKTLEPSVGGGPVSPSKAVQSMKNTEGVSPEQLVDAQATSSAAMNASPGAAASIERTSLSVPDGLVEIIEKGVSSEVAKAVGNELDGLYRRFDEDRRSWDIAAAAKQDQVLRLISSTLSDNVEKNLERIISRTIETEVVPKIINTTSVSLSKQLNDVISKQLSQIVPAEVHRGLSDYIPRTLERPEIVSMISEAVGQNLASHVEGEFARALHTAIVPVFRNIAFRSIEKVAIDIEHQLQAQMKQYEIQRHTDSLKIDQLTTLVRGLSETVTSMETAQADFQNEMSRLSHRLSARHHDEENKRLSQQHAAYQTSSNDILASQSPEEVELAEIAELMEEGKYEEGSFKWLQSSQQADLFDNLFVHLNPAYLTELEPIILLSVGAAVTSSLQTNLSERLTWLEVVLQTINLMDPEIRGVAPKIMDVLIQRLESLYMAIAENNPHDPILRRIPPLSRRARELRGSC